MKRRLTTNTTATTTPKSSSRNAVILPFREKVLANQSIVEIDLPESTLQRDYYFSDLEILPSYHSQQAAELKLNDDPEFTTPVAEIMNYKVTFSTVTFKEIPEFTVTENSVSAFIRNFNAHVEASSPRYRNILPVWMDWTDLTETGEPFSGNMNKFVEQNMLKYYDAATEKNTVFNALPTSLAQFNVTNNYAIPIYPRDNVNIRFRIFLAPYSKVVLRSEELVKGLGFSTLTPSNRQYHLVNNQDKMTLLVGDKVPLIDFEKIGMKVDVFPLPFNSPDEVLTTTGLMLLRPDKLMEDINELLTASARNTNFNLRMNYMKEKLRYRFVFPDSKPVVVKINLPKRVAAALGYENNEITAATRSTPIRSQDIKFETDKKALTLCMDTGPIIVTQHRCTSDNLVGSSDLWLATVTPCQPGKLKCNFSRLTYAPPLNLSSLKPSARKSGYRSVPLQLHVFDDNGKMQPLNWPCSTYMQGQLVGLEHVCSF